MAVYVQCPHCEHPQVIRANRLGKPLFCRQCGWAFKATGQAGAVRPLPVSSMGELVTRRSGGGKVFVIA